MKLSRLHIWVFLGLAILVWWLVLLISGTPVTFDHLTPFGSVVGFLAVVGVVLDKWLWRWRRLQGWFVSRPDLRGTWLVELESDWVDPKTKEKTPPITCYMGVEQTLSTLQMHLMTPESESWFVAHEIGPAPSDSGYQVVGVYTNKPQIHLRGERSEIHWGTLVLNTHGPSKAKPETLTGEYWTDRKTSGRMTFSRRIPEILTRFDDAREAF